MVLASKVAIVTGGAVRVGRALVLALAEAGCDVLIHYGRSAESAHQTQRDAEAFGVRAAVLAADLRQPSAPQAIVDSAMATFGRIDILINNAAIFPEEDSFTGTDAALWDTLFALNLRAPFLLMQAFAERVSAESHAKIINITDARIFRPDTDHFAYRLTKQGLLTMTEMAAQELAPRITVNGVALGAILPPPGQAQAYLDAIADQRVPLRRAGSAEIVAENVLHLLHQDFLTGVTIKIDGGQFL